MPSLNLSVWLPSLKLNIMIEKDNKRQVGTLVIIIIRVKFEIFFLVLV
jgi:hypothetical protein